MERHKSDIQIRILPMERTLSYFVFYIINVTFQVTLE